MAISPDASIDDRVEVLQELVSLRANIDSAALADALGSTGFNISVAPSSTRGRTLSSKQGDHVTAYSVYWDGVRVALGTYIREELSSQTFHVSDFASKVYSGLQSEITALTHCGFYKNVEEISSEIEKLLIETELKQVHSASDSESDSDELLEGKIYLLLKDVGRKKPELQSKARELLLSFMLRKHLDSWSREMENSAVKLTKLRDLYEQELEDIRKAEQVVDLSIIAKKDGAIGPGTERLLEAVDLFAKVDHKMRKTVIRERYFYQVVREFAEKKLLYQNQMPFATFFKIPGFEADSSEGAEVKVALEKLRKFHSSSDVLGQSEIINLMKSLLFYPKVPDDKLRLLEAERKETLTNNRKSIMSCLMIRNNDEPVLKFVIARHIHSVINAFPNLATSQNIEEIKHKL